MGEDGHTASLFPGSYALNEGSKWVMTTKPESAGHDRVTLTVPVFNHAARVVFLVAGAAKAERLAQVFSRKYYCRNISHPYPLRVSIQLRDRWSGWLIVLQLRSFEHGHGAA